MTQLAAKHRAVNLSQGFPDFDGPDFMIEAAHDAMRSGHNQYARSVGVPELNRAIADFWRRETGEGIDPDTEVTVTSGCTEAVIATLLGLVNPGEEVILFEPYYDSYRACISIAGAEPRFVTLRPPTGAAAGDIVSEPFTFDPDQLRAAFSSRTAAIIVNTPHNPTGKVFTREELELIAELCIEHNAVAITDEVYERLIYEPDRLPHIRLATLPGMAERTVTLSSLGKTFSFTGWKIGWAIAPAALSASVRAAHQYLTFATATPLQHAAAMALNRGEDYVRSLVNDYKRRRSMLATGLAELGFIVYMPHGSYFILADHSAFGEKSDVDFCMRLITEAGVAAIPPSVFYDNRDNGKKLVRLAFCKRDETIREALQRMEKLKKPHG
ncbi:MAG: aminotransferase class I/II-fold pyridoxal phosphate-dependent enzyme [Phycisphaeraceae bacterium]|nr:MAG: aminotransferase class I/II-fold pyridoxal phosphate-dependent enzyme [Phycisphaeraceae bacterium]